MFAMSTGVLSMRLKMISKKTALKILRLWKKGRNIWEISQLTKVSESVVYDVIRSGE